MVKDSNSPIGKCTNCSKELKRNFFYVIREEEIIKKRFCPECFQQEWNNFTPHHKVWGCYKCHESGKIEKDKEGKLKDLSKCLKCPSEDIWISEAYEEKAEKVISCDNSGNFPFRSAKHGRTILMIMVIVSVGFCGLTSWILNREEKMS